MVAIARSRMFLCAKAVESHIFVSTIVAAPMSNAQYMIYLSSRAFSFRLAFRVVRLGAGCSRDRTCTAQPRSEVSMQSSFLAPAHRAFTSGFKWFHQPIKGLFMRTITAAPCCRLATARQGLVGPEKMTSVPMNAHLDRESVEGPI
jgi:hypothetical protein